MISSLAVAAVASIGIGYLVSRSGTSDDSTTLTSTVEVQPPGIGTNAAVTGTPFPEVDIETLDGNTINSSELIGQPLIVNIWYSTCVPCRKELPAFAQVHAEFGDTVRFVGINPLDSADVNESFARDRGVQYELYGDPDGRFTTAAGIVTAPVTLIVAADGTIVRQTGELTADRLREIIETDLL